MRLVVTGFLVAVGIALFLSLQFTAKATTQKEVEASPYSVSYTHLTLPTIYSV